MAQVLRIWWPVFIALLLIQMGNGLAGSLISVTGESAHVSPLVQGLILSAFFGGSIVGSFSAPLLIARTSHALSAALYTWILVFTTAGFAVSGDPWIWILMRLAAGAAITGMFASIEGWLSLSISNDIRARVFSIYIFIQLAGLASGQLLLSARSVGTSPLFLFSAGLMALAALCYHAERARSPASASATHVAFFRLVFRARLGVLCICLSGFSWAALMASGPALVEMLGLSDLNKSLFMALAVVSGMASQLPVGWLADHFDRRRVLASLSTVAALGAILPLFDLGQSSLFAFSAIYGAATFPLYAVGVACISEVMDQGERTSASAIMIVLFDIGAVAAPLLLAQGMALFGPTAYFLLQFVPHALFAIALTTLVFTRRQ